MNNEWKAFSELQEEHGKLRKAYHLLDSTAMHRLDLLTRTHKLYLDGGKLPNHLLLDIDRELRQAKGL